MTPTTAGFVARLVPGRSELAIGALVVIVEIVLASSYLVITGADTRLATLVYPFVWINVSLWAFATTSPPVTDRRHRSVASLVGAGYFGVLAVVSGLIWISPAYTDPSIPTSVRLVLASVPPGWGPAVIYVGEIVSVTIIPFKLIGYLALAYLVYVTVLDAAGSVITGIVGVFSCVSCVWPVIGTVATSALGSGSAVATVATTQPYGVSTVVFVSAVALLAWRPQWGSR